MPAFVRVEVSIRRHRKVVRLGRLMGLTDERTIVGGLVLLWMAVRESAPDGDITSWSAQDVAAAAGFDDQDADRFWHSLIQVGFIEAGGGRVILHDWREHNGQFLKDAERMRSVRERARTHTNVHECSPLARADGEERRGEETRTENLVPTPLSDATAPDDLVLTPPSPKRDTRKAADRKDWLEGFDEFWTAYPNRANSSKKDALKFWMTLIPKDYSTADDLFSDILETLEESKTAWRTEGADEKHIPHHVVWLRRELWRNRAEG
jgi:hypothetical protein